MRVLHRLTGDGLPRYPPARRSGSVLAILQVASLRLSRVTPHESITVMSGLCLPHVVVSRKS